MRYVFLAAIAAAALTIGTSTAQAEHLRRPAPYCPTGIGGYGYGAPSYSVRSYSSYRSPVYSSRSIHSYSPYHSSVRSYSHSARYGAYGRTPYGAYGHKPYGVYGHKPYGVHGHGRHYSNYGRGGHIGINTGRVGFHLDF